MPEKSVRQKKSEGLFRPSVLQRNAVPPGRKFLAGIPANRPCHVPTQFPPDRTRHNPPKMLASGQDQSCHDPAKPVYP